MMSSRKTTFRFGLAQYQAGDYTQHMCFTNVQLHCQKWGGRIRFGWTLHVHAINNPIKPLHYLCVVHHAVWESPDLELVDITPIDKSSPPLMTAKGQILFLVDDAAIPKTHLMLGLPSKFYALHHDIALMEYVEKLNAIEQQECATSYKKAQQGLIKLSV